MIKNIIFDFGDIFINLDKPAIFKHMALFGFTELTPELDTLAKDYEMGLMSSDSYVTALNEIFPQADKERIVSAWNSIILDFPEHRLDFIEKLKKQNTYRLFLLSNTNDLHITYVKETMGLDRYNRFKNCFEEFYLSHEIHMRKPNADIYEYVLTQNGLRPTETLFIDDTKENTDSASLLGIKVWNLSVGQEDITELTKRI
ncbi:haloacid dehalogenase [Maribacter sp. 4U21]|uniref:HAD family hydrolase n=1 Tax=Maribacter sp. 4U21 TaxID=1889779 RepID=UPI000C14C735|nr:HAD family phosphatase [Maribacter sp. 4U21]PIB23685.1 haloacid dehalogenase [Maribacter sp. 4U21]